VRLIKETASYGCQIWQTLSKEEVENQFDHKNLNLDVFLNLNPNPPKILQW
jgi:hypothetical protein